MVIIWGREGGYIRRLVDCGRRLYFCVIGFCGAAVYTVIREVIP